MVRSTSSCFKIITCSSDHVDDDEDDHQQIESKGSTDKRGWSFRKRSDRHRVVGNTTTLEASSTGSRENAEGTSIDCHAQTKPTVSGKISSLLKDEVIPLSTAVNSKSSDNVVSTENTCTFDPLISKESLSETSSLSIMGNATNIDPIMDESFAVIMQTAIRGYLSQRALLQLKNVVKLQASVRGHLVRRQAVGTLRCVRGIIKMQALVRAHHAQISLKGSVIEANLADKHGRKDQSVKPWDNKTPGTKANPDTSSTEKFLGNAFARQLLESTPKKKPIQIKCDPLKPDSAWKWLERWMSVSSADSDQPQKPEFNQKNEEQVERVDTTSFGLETEVPAEVISVSTDLKPSVTKTKLAPDGKGNVITCNEDKFDVQFYGPTSSLTKDEGVSEAQQTSSKMEINQTEFPLDATSVTLLGLIPSKPDYDSEQPKHSRNEVASEQLETDGKKIVIGSRKTCNPAFVAAQSKFEELSSIATSDLSISSTSLDARVELKSNSLFSSVDSLTRTKETVMSENSISRDPEIHIGSSERDIKPSVSSTLDSPDRPEVRSGENKNESKVEEMTSDLNSTSGKASSPENLDVEVMTQLNLLHPVTVQPGKVEYANGEVVGSAAEDSLHIEPPERSASDVQIQNVIAIDQQAYPSSPEGSQRSHVTAPESHRTPPSQVSVKAKRKELSKSGHTRNSNSKSADKKWPSNPNHDNSKNGKRRKSFGSARPDHADQEPSENTSNSLPSYMQATESARAKALANNSPRSSPDVQDNDLYIKKRHSLPTANGKQGSPRVQSSTPQAQQGTKGDNTHSFRERWQR